jgi:hypothetical protein
MPSLSYLILPPARRRVDLFLRIAPRRIVAFSNREKYGAAKPAFGKPPRAKRRVLLARTCIVGGEKSLVGTLDLRRFSAA